jgi:ferric-dicitrate binding protein FerR (iron transport regulator)
MLRVQERSRAALVLSNEVLLRLDQHTTITLAGLEARTALLELLTGAVYFFSRIPRSLRVITPFVNAALEGTEGLIRVERNQTVVSILAGLAETSNATGSRTLTSGQSAVAQAGQAPTLTGVQLRVLVQWALYYPPILDYRPADFRGGC